MDRPVLRLRIQARLRLALRTKGYRFSDINDIVKGLDDDTLEAATAATAAQLKTDIPPVMLGGEEKVGGKFLDFLDQFLNSEFGKLLIEILIKALTGV